MSNILFVVDHESPALADALRPVFAVRRHELPDALLDLRIPPHAILLRCSPWVLASLTEVRKRFPSAWIIVYADEESFGAAIRAMDGGADAYFDKPSLDTIRAAIIRDRALVQELQQEQRKALFVSPVMRRVVDMVPRLARVDAPIFITGESGTGKEVIANMIHEASPRAAKPFVKVNCAALPQELIESELFGSQKGGFTGSETRSGLFVEADGGTLLLDELAEMRIDVQPKLLRVLQDKEVRAVGATTPVHVDVRIIAATNRHPSVAINENRLRLDLFYRLSTLEIELPPLRARQEEILPLARHFLAVEAVRHSYPVPVLDEAAEKALLAYRWPGNVRELQAVILRSLLHNLGALSLSEADLRFGPSIERDDAPDRQKFLSLLQKYDGSASQVAAAMHIHRCTVYELADRYNIDLSDFKATKKPGR